MGAPQPVARHLLAEGSEKLVGERQEVAAREVIFGVAAPGVPEVETGGMAADGARLIVDSHPVEPGPPAQVHVFQVHEIGRVEAAQFTEHGTRDQAERGAGPGSLASRGIELFGMLLWPLARLDNGGADSE